MHARFRAISSCTCLLQLALESCHSCESAGQQFPYSPSPVPDLVLAWICYDAVLLERIWGRPTTYLPYLLFFQPLRLSTDLLYLHLLFTHPLLHSSSSSLFPFTYVTLNHALLIIHSLPPPPPFPLTRCFLLVGPVLIPIHPASLKPAIAVFSACPLARFRCMTIYDFERCPSFPNNLLTNVKRFVDHDHRGGNQPPL